MTGLPNHIHTFQRQYFSATERIINRKDQLVLFIDKSIIKLSHENGSAYYSVDWAEARKELKFNSLVEDKLDYNNILYKTTL